MVYKSYILFLSIEEIGNMSDDIVELIMLLFCNTFVSARTQCQLIAMLKITLVMC